MEMEDTEGLLLTSGHTPASPSAAARPKSCTGRCGAGWRSAAAVSTLLLAPLAVAIAGLPGTFALRGPRAAAVGKEDVGLVALTAGAVCEDEDGAELCAMKKEAQEVARVGLAKAVKQAKASASKVHHTWMKPRTFFNWFNRIDTSDLPRGPGPAYQGESSPPDIKRVHTTYASCDCNTGLNWVTFWPDGDRGSNVTVDAMAIRWVKWGKNVTTVSWVCDGMNYYMKASVDIGSKQWFSLQVYPETKGDFFGHCGQSTGHLRFNNWDSTDYTSSVPFTTATDGYACIKIPALLRTAKGTLIAFAEARSPDCDDFATTDLVYKRSTDGGKTWSKLSVLVKVTGDRKDLGLCGKELVIGNIAPVQLREDSKHHPGRILAPYTRNNYKSWICYSDDDGETWAGDAEIPDVTNTVPEGPDCDRGMSYFGYDIDHLNADTADDLVKFAAYLCYNIRDPYNHPRWKSKLSGPWQFVGAGPPGALQLKSGRVLVPAYHSYVRGLDAGHGQLPTSQMFNNFALGHVLISDDGGDTWRLGEEWPIGEGANENQMVQLSNGSVLTNSRALSTGSPQHRLQSRSDDGGETFSPSTFTTIPQPFNGCQGSTIGGAGDTVYVTSPDPPKATSLLQHVADKIKCDVNLTGRNQLTVWKSTDGGHSYPRKHLIDPGLSAQTSLQYHDGKIWLLYEQADPAPKTSVKDFLLEEVLENLEILLPTRFVFRELLP